MYNDLAVLQTDTSTSSSWSLGFPLQVGGRHYSVHSAILLIEEPELTENKHLLKMGEGRKKETEKESKRKIREKIKREKDAIRTAASVREAKRPFERK